MTGPVRVCLGVVLLIFLASCSSSSHPAAQKTVLNWFTNSGGNAWVTTLDPATVADAMSSADIQLINAGLVRIDDATLRPVPDLASWSASADGRTWTFTIRRDARFSNGDLVTAEDAAWSLTRALLPSTRSAVAVTYLGRIQGATRVATGAASTLAGVTVLNARTLRVTLDAPVSYFLAALAQPPGDVLDRRVMEGKAPDDYLSNTCVGNVGAGPFRLACRNDSGDRSSFYPPDATPTLNMEPNPHYYGPKPRIRLRLPFFPSSEAAWSEFTHERLDGVSVPTSHLAAARGMSGFVRASLLQTDSIVPDVSMPPFKDRNCRLAVAYAIDRVYITRQVLLGVEAPLYGVVPPGLVGYLPAEQDIPHYNPARARAYLQRCPGSLQGVQLAYDSARPDLTREYQAIRDELRAVGARVILRPLAFHDWLDLYRSPLRRSKPRVSLVQFFWIADYPDAQDWCQTILRSGGNFNLGGFSDPSYDRLVDQAALEASAARRADLYQRAQRIAVNSGAWIGIGYAYGAYVISARVHGMVATSDGIQPQGGNWSLVRLSG